ncbi:MAG: MAPEG family protein [Caulobacteraceae bacterium]
MIDLTYICGCRTELMVLAAAIALGIFQLGWAAVASRGQQGLKWARGPRDEPRPVAGVAGRLNRAFTNLMETFPFFAAAVLGIAVTDSWSWLSQWGSLIYIAARILYVPLYAVGVKGGRSLVWFISLIGLLMVLAAFVMQGSGGLPPVVQV